MAYEPNNVDGKQKQTFKGDWSCSKCGAPIKELPFQPDPARVGELMCFDCMKAKKGYGNKAQGERKMFSGNWHCSKCGTSITELPFPPNPAREGELLCINCWKSKQT